MGLFDVFSKGGKYFGKAIEPKCEYCEFGKRSTDGDKVLCTKKGMVDASSHCPKFVYSPLKRIPEKQLKRVGWLEGDYDEKDDDELAKLRAEREKQNAAAQGQNAAPAAQQAQAPAIAPNQAPRTQEIAPNQTPRAQAAGADLAALAAMAEAAGDYTPAEQQETEASAETTLSNM